MIAWLIVVGYALIGIGMSRVAFTREYRRVYAIYGTHSSTIEHIDVQVIPWIAFFLWPLFAVWLFLIRPIGTVVGPGLARWYMAPARKAVKS